MTEQIREKCELLAKNRTNISDKFVFEDGLMCVAAGLIYTEADKEADVEKLAECRKILKKYTGVFSTYRKTVELVLLSKMDLSGDPEKYISDVKAVCDIIRGKKIMDNANMILASVLICDQGQQERAEEIAAKYHELMKRLNKEHPVLTSSEDMSYVMLLALSGRDIDAVMYDIDACSTYLKKTCRIKAGSNAVQGLSEVLAVTDGDIKEKCDRVVRIFNTFADHKADFGTDCELSSLGTLIDIDTDTDTLVDEIIEAENLLKDMKGFQNSSMDRKKRLMYAALLAAESYKKESAAAGNSGVSSALEIVKAKQISMMISVLSSLVSSLAELLEKRKED